MLERAGIGVHVFPCRSGYVRREPFKTGKTRLCLYRCRGGDHDRRHAGRICGIDFCHQIPDAVHQEARFQSLRLVPYRTRCDCAAVFRNQNRNSESIKSNNSENLPGKIEEEVS